MFSPSVSFAVHLQSGSASKRGTARPARRALLEGLVVLSFGVHQSRSAVGVELAALVVEAVADLVADHAADGAVVHRGIGFGSKNGGCRIAAGKTISLMSGL